MTTATMTVSRAARGAPRAAILSPALLALALLSLLAPASSAQSREPSHRQTTGAPQTAGGFGEYVKALGDLDNDGYDDYAVSARNFQVGGISVGQVYAYSGRSGALLLTIDGTQSGAGFGVGVADVGDVTGDGVRDLVIGSPFFDNSGLNSVGRVACYSGADGAQVWERIGDSLLAELGRHVVAFGPTSGGAAAVAVSEGGFDTTSLLNVGRVVYLAPATGTLLGWTEGDLANKRLGAVMVGYPEASIIYASTNHGLVYNAGFSGGVSVATNVLPTVLGSADQTSLAIMTGPTPGSFRFAAGYRSADSNGFVNNGVIQLFDLGGGVPLLTIDGPHQIASAGRFMSHGRDIDGDGIDELIYLHDGTSFAQPATIKVVTQGGLEIDSIDYAGFNTGELASLLDVNGDGRGELLVGAANGNALLFEATLFTQGLKEGTPGSTLGGFTRGFDIDAGDSHAGAIYGQIYGLSGAWPGLVPAPGAPLIPLNVDGNTLTILGLSGTPLFPDAIGFLDGAGKASTTMALNLGLSVLLSGTEFTSCAVVIPVSSTDVVFASNPDVFVIP